MNTTKVDFMGYLLSLAQVQNYNKLNLDVDFLFLYQGPWVHQHLVYHPHLKGGFPPDLSTEVGGHAFFLRHML